MTSALWKSAPAWAKWAAKDATGRAHFYAEEPFIEEDGAPQWLVVDGHHRWERAKRSIPGPWRKSLRERPVELITGKTAAMLRKAFKQVRRGQVVERPSFNPTPSKPRKPRPSRAVILSLLGACQIRLTAMNTSAAHAASWVEPRSSSTTCFLERLAKVLPLPHARRGLK